MQQTLKSMKRVNFQDCDPLRHLNNLSYIQYFINCREDQLCEQKVFDINEHAMSTGNAWVVLSHNIKYIRPASLGEVVEIWSRSLTCENGNLLVEFFMFSPKDRKLKAVMHSRFAYCSIKKKRRIGMEGAIKDLVEETCLYPGRSILDFPLDSRVAEIQREIS